MPSIKALEKCQNQRKIILWHFDYHFATCISSLISSQNSCIENTASFPTSRPQEETLTCRRPKSGVVNVFLQTSNDSEGLLKMSHFNLLTPLQSSGWQMPPSILCKSEVLMVAGMVCWAAWNPSEDWNCEVRDPDTRLLATRSPKSHGITFLFSSILAFWKSKDIKANITLLPTRVE